MTTTHIGNSASSSEEGIVDAETGEPPKKAFKSSRTKLTLTEQDAIDIFLLKDKHGFPTSHAASRFLGLKYKVSSKAIRDVWSGRLWLETTYDLWDLSSSASRPQRRIVGRPKGKKDSAPQKLKSKQDPEPPTVPVPAPFLQGLRKLLSDQMRRVMRAARLGEPGPPAPAFAGVSPERAAACAPRET